MNRTEEEFRQRLLDIRTDIAMIEANHHRDTNVDYEKEIDRLKLEARAIKKEFANKRISEIREENLEERGKRYAKH